MSDPEERELPTDIGDTLPVNPQEDFKKVLPIPGLYDAAIQFIRYEKLPDTDKYNPGLYQARVTYRLENCDNPEYNGVSVSGFGKNLAMVTNGGEDKSFGWAGRRGKGGWLRTLGFDPDKPPTTSELQGLPVKLRLGTKDGKDGRVFVTVEQMWSRMDEV